MRTYGASRRRTGRSQAEFFIHVAEKSVTSSCQPGDSRILDLSRRHRHLEQSVTIAGDAMVAARRANTTGTSDESMMRDGH